MVMTTSLSVAECRDALKSVLRRSALLMRPGDQWLGWVKANRFAFWPIGVSRFTGLEVVHRFDGTMAPAGGGTWIEGRVRLHPVSLCVLAATALFIVLTLAMLGAAAASHMFHFGLPSGIREEIVPSVVVTPLLTAYVVTTARRSRGDRGRMQEFLSRELDAEVQLDQSP